jgi:RNase P subunit RPR2
MTIESMLQTIKQTFCEHELEVLYLDSRFYMERSVPVRDWVCRCRKCNKIMRVESRRSVL